MPEVWFVIQTWLCSNPRQDWRQLGSFSLIFSPFRYKNIWILHVFKQVNVSFHLISQEFSHPPLSLHFFFLLNVTERTYVRDRETEAEAETWGQALSTFTFLLSVLGWQPCVRVSAFCSRWPSKLLPGSLGSQLSLTKARVLTAWGPVDSLLSSGLWGLWGLWRAAGSPSRDNQDNRSVLTQLPPTTYSHS